MSPLKLMLPLLFTQNSVYGPPKKRRPPENAPVRSSADDDPSSLAGKTFEPNPSGPPNVRSSGAACATVAVAMLQSARTKEKNPRQSWACVMADARLPHRATGE